MSCLLLLAACGGEPAVNPGTVEVCNGVDDDGDGSVDPATSADAQTWYIDYDGDGHGSTSFTELGCAAPVGYVANADDCDDTDAADHPGASETCDGDDDDCDTLVDDADDDVDLATGGTWYGDGDGDGYGDAAARVAACEQPAGAVGDATDCDDGDAAVNLAASELCDGIDNDCDGSVDEDDAVDALTWYGDVDGDGFGDATVPVTACAEPLGYVSDATDCDDTDAAVYPGSPEECDGDDDDCDGRTDNDAPCDFPVQFNDDPACASYGNAYIFMNWTYYDPKIWTDAVASCESLGYAPLVVDDACEWDWIEAAAPTGAPSEWWVGLYCASGACTSRGDFVWVDGSAGYVTWSGGTYDPSYECAYLDAFMVTSTTKSMWATAYRCDDAHGVICEAP